MKTTRAERLGHREMILGSKVAGGYVGGVISHDEVLDLLYDADLCADMEADLARLRRIEIEISVLLAESDNGRVDSHFAQYMLDVIRCLLVGGPYERCAE